MNRTETKLNRIAELSKQDPRLKFQWLMQHFSPEGLRGCFDELDGKKAVGADGKTKEDYRYELNENLERLVERMKRMGYRPGPVREVFIPKPGKLGAKRPLGISNIEDKIVQGMMKKVLEAIYEPQFLELSYGFRPGRGCRDALRALHQHLYHHEVEAVIDVDLENFFGSIDHQVLMDFLRLRISDERFLRYVVRMLKAGVLSQGELRKTEAGTPQGSLCSPVLSNIVAHYVIDLWFTQVVKDYVRGPVRVFRYADDLVVCCRYRTDAQRVKQALGWRLDKYQLKMNSEKTKIVSFSKNQLFFQNKRQGTFDFLGFTFVLGRSKKGNVIPKVRTSGKRFRAKLKVVKQWCKVSRHRLRLRPLWLAFTRKLEGHCQYYGTSFNTDQVRRFIFRAVFIFFKWINRRSQKKSLNWEQFSRFLDRYPPPRATVCWSLFMSCKETNVVS